MPKYDFECDACDIYLELERPMSAASSHVRCPICAQDARRVYSMPKLLMKGDPRDNRPVWHKHDGYAHAHAPRRGRHKNPTDDH